MYMNLQYYCKGMKYTNEFRFTNMFSKHAPLSARFTFYMCCNIYMHLRGVATPMLSANKHYHHHHIYIYINCTII